MKAAQSLLTLLCQCALKPVSTLFLWDSPAQHAGLSCPVQAGKMPVPPELIRDRRLFDYISVLIAVMVGLIATGCAVKTSSGTLDFERIKENMDKKAQLVSRFRLDFTRTRRSCTFDRPLTVQGKLVFQKPDRFRVTTSGDVNVEVLSDGRFLALVHDGKDREIHTLHGDRDRALFADPLMALLEGFGNGTMTRVAAVPDAAHENTAAIEITSDPSSRTERKYKILAWFTPDGIIEKARFVSENGDNDEIQVISWAVLPANDPEIAELERRLQQVKAARSTVPGTRNTAGAPPAIRASCSEDR